MSKSGTAPALPPGWCWATVGDTGQYINGFAFKPEHREIAGRPIIRIQNLTDPSKPLHRTSLDVPDTYHVATGDILVSWSATVDVFHWHREPALVNQHIFKVVPDEDLIDKTFLFYWLKVAVAQLLDSEHLHGSTMKHINRGPFMAHRIPLPPLPEQRRIADRLEELLPDLDAGVAELQAAQRKLAQYRQSLLKAAVEGTLTAGWRATHGAPRETGADLLQRILTERRARWEQKQLAKFAEKKEAPPRGWQSKYREPVFANLTDLPVLPAGWEWASLDMLGEIASGVAKGTKRATSVSTREVPYLRVANVQRGYLDLTQIKTIPATDSDIAELRLHPGDILFNEGGDLDKLGRGWVWNGEIPECIHQNHVFRMRPSLSATPSEFISHHGNSFGREWFKNAGKQTTNLASISMTILRAFPVPVPPASESQEILARLGPLLSVAAEQEASIKRGLAMALAQRKNIIRVAFAGQLVEQNHSDEPASAMLARIRSKQMASDKAPKVRKTRPHKEIALMERRLVDVLAEAGDWMSAQDAFRECGVANGASTEQVEALYAELRVLDKEGKLDVEAVTDPRGRKVHDKLKLRTT